MPPTTTLPAAPLLTALEALALALPVIEPLLDAMPVALDTLVVIDMLDMLLLMEAEAEVLALPDDEATPVAATRLAVPPPMVEREVHMEVAPWGWGSGVWASPWLKVEPE